LLDRDPAKRPTAKQALEHPFLRGGSSERSTGGAHAL
jgi:calcium-dependent protein kinase